VLTYPAPLPCVSRVEGHSSVIATAVRRLPMEAGNARQRRTHRTLPRSLALVFVMDQSIYAAWTSWVNAHAYSDFILLALPGPLAGAAGTPTTPTPVRFISDIAAELVPLHRRWLWRARVAAEWRVLP
jgi:hypothetical protein